MDNLVCAPTGRITYRKLRGLLNQMSEFQLDCDVTIEIAWDNECFAGELTICDEDHDSLDDFHPIIRSLANKNDYMHDVEFMKSLYQRAIDKKLSKSRAIDFTLFYFRRFGIQKDTGYQDDWIERFLKGTEFVYGDNESQKILTSVVDEVNFLVSVII